MNNRIAGYDLIRSVAILIVFFAHVLEEQSTNNCVLLAVRSLNPGLTMSLLGFISATLLTDREKESGAFLIKRFTRIYIPLIICLLLVVCIHALLGKKVITQHMLLHFMGLSAFFEVFLIQNKATIGDGLWFITAILIMYLILPFLRSLFKHPRRMIHLIVVGLGCTCLNFVMYGTSSTWNVVISFSVGVYFGVNNRISQLINTATSRSILSSLVLLVIAVLATEGLLPYEVRNLLFVFYPIAFVPTLFAVAKRLPPSIIAICGFFSALSYEFYILHFYFINKGFREIFPIQAGLGVQIVISFVLILVLAYAISKIAARLRNVINLYLLAGRE